MSNQKEAAEYLNGYNTAKREAQEQIDRITAYSAECIEKLLQQVPKWIPVTERLPDKHGKPYVCLLTFPQGGQFPYILNWYEYGDNGYVNGQHFQDEGLDGMKVTHWMPLPEPPNMEVNKNDR